MAEVTCVLSNKQLTNQDKTPTVVSRAMAKHNLETEPEEGYELVQVISEERGKNNKQNVTLPSAGVFLNLLHSKTEKK